ncbi:FtsW/RodA/SpoVE family cell cycle protein [Caulobacter sp. 602-1]|uniref:FtsW/RodA/SpoVE family cell cycle protein n=1 Tax=Caulobacter sp. 602-1 TaxID=2492472 RepID=UPI000F644259|nr:FtsW/RodA/SpoVE family cell cycle protein [Caulobacter sp. 602-1]RRN62355.1 FtsW/RodA/SpoVE family cell cycle protein [Caulobacter sp. 602-1]
MRKAAVTLQVVATLAISVLAIRVAGGSSSAMVLQVAAGLAGALLALVVAWLVRPPGRVAAVIVLALTLAIEAYILVAGVSMEGVRRWVALGPLQLHAASLLVPLAAWTAAQRLDAIAAVLLAATLAVLAAQPDAASVLALTLALGAVALVDRSKRRLAGILAVVGAAGVAWALSRPDPLPAVDHVELVVRRAFEASPTMGSLAAVALIAIPLAMLWSRRTPAALALAAAWAGFVLANLIANYPAPVIGAGAAPVLGWLLSVGLTFATPAAKQSP